MNHLISREAVIDLIDKRIAELKPDKGSIWLRNDEAINIRTEVEGLPTTYDVDKVIEDIEDYGKYKGILMITEGISDCDNYIPVREVKKIVKAGGREE